MHLDSSLYSQVFSYFVFLTMIAALLRPSWSLSASVALYALLDLGPESLHRADIEDMSAPIYLCQQTTQRIGLEHTVSNPRAFISETQHGRCLMRSAHGQCHQPSCATRVVVENGSCNRTYSALTLHNARRSRYV
jgi:hypothetical protein